VNRTGRGLGAGGAYGLQQAFDAIRLDPRSVLANVDGDFTQPVGLIEGQAKVGVVEQDGLDSGPQGRLLGAHLRQGAQGFELQMPVLRLSMQDEGPVFANHGIQRPGLHDVIAPARAGSRHGHHPQTCLSQALKRNQRFRRQAAMQGERVIDIGQDPLNTRPFGAER